MKRLQVAAEKGDASAQFNLGVLYDNRLDDNGHPIGSNRAQALKWLQMARKDLVQEYEALDQPEKAEPFRAELARLSQNAPKIVSKN